MPLQDRKIKDNTSIRTPSAEHRRTVSDAASWMQVVLGGIGVVVAIVAAVFGYFAWVQPHAPSPSGAGPADPPAAAETLSTTKLSTGPTPGSTAQAAAAPTSATAHPAAGDTVALGTLTPTAGGANIHAGGGGLVMPCASGQSTDRQRTVDYDLLRRYAALETDLTVSKAPDADSRVQIKIFADGREAANRTLRKAPAIRLKVPLAGTEKLRIQLTCEFPDSEITLGNPSLAHSS